MARIIQLNVQTNENEVMQALGRIDARATQLSQRTYRINIDTSTIEGLERLTRNEYLLRRQQEITAQTANRRAEAEARAAQERERTTRVTERATQTERQHERQLERTARQTEEATQQNYLLGASLGNVAVRMATWKVMGDIIAAPIRAMREAIDTLQDVDDQMVEIRKVTDLTGQQLEELQVTAFKTASQYGENVTGYLESVATYSRASYQELSESLAELSTKAQIVGDMTAKTANQFLLSVDAAYKYNGSITELTKVLDGANEIDNKYATSIEKISEGLGKVAPIAAQAHVGVNELTAMLGTITATTQRSGTEAATAARALMLNIIGDTKTEIEEGVTWTTGEIAGLRDVIKTYAPEAYKAAEATQSVINPMEAIGGLAKSMQDGLLTEQQLMSMVSDIGGKLRTSQLLALIQNYDMYQSMLADYGNAIGSADKEVENALDSWSRKTEILKNTWAEFMQNFVNSDMMKGGIDALTGFVKLLDSGLGAVILLTAAAWGLQRAWVALVPAIADFIAATTVEAALSGVSALTVGFQALTAAMFANPLFWVAASGLAIWGAAELFDALTKSTEELAEASANEAEKLNDINEQLETASDRIKELEEKGPLTFVEQEELEKLKETTAELEKQKEIQEDIAEESNKEYRKSLEKDVSKKRYGPEQQVNDHGNYTYSAPTMDVGEAISYYSSEYAKGVEGAKLELEKLRQEYAEYIEDYDKDDTTSQYWQGLVDSIDKVIFPAREATEAFDGMGNVVKDKLIDLAKAGELNEKAVGKLALKFTELAVVMYESGTTAQQVAENYNAIAKGMAEAGEAATSLESIPSMIDKMSDAYNAIAKAQDQISKNGKITLSTVKDLTESGLQKYIKETADGFILADGALEKYSESQIKEYEIALSESKQAAVNLINQNSEEKVAIDETTEAIKVKIEAMMAAARVEMVAISNSEVNNRGSMYAQAERAKSQAEYKKAAAIYKEAANALEGLGNATENLENARRVLSSLADEYENTGKKAKDATKEATQALSALSSVALKKVKAETDALTDAIDKQVDSYEDMRDAADDAYEDRLDALEKAYNLEKTASEERIDQLEKERDAATESIDAQIEALQQQQDAEERELALKEKQLAVEEALKNLADAKNERTVRYFDETTGQWNWEADRRAVLEAEQAVTDAQSSLDEYIKKLGYEDAINQLKAQKELIKADYDKQIEAIKANQKLLETQYKANKEQLENERQAAKEYYNGIIDDLKNQKDSIKAQYDAYKSSWDTIEQSLSEKATDVTEALANLSKVAPELVNTVVSLLQQVGVNTGNYGITPTTPTTPTNPGGTSTYPGSLIKQGQTSDYVKQIQAALGVKQTGYFGTETLAAVKAFQKANGLKEDGIVGTATWARLFGSYTSTNSAWDSALNANTANVNSFMGNNGLLSGSVSNTSISNPITNNQSSTDSHDQNMYIGSIPLTESQQGLTLRQLGQELSVLSLYSDLK